MGRGDVAHPPPCRQGDCGKEGKRDADAPVLAVQQDQHADEQQSVSEQLEHQERKEIRERVHVPVDALDHLARGVRVVERHIEPQAVVGQVGAQFVGRPPAHVLAEIGRRDGGRLLQQGHAEKEQCRPQKCLRGGAALCRVDELARDLRIEELEADGTKKEHGEQDDRRPLRPKVVDEQVPVLSEGDLHRISFLVHRQERPTVSNSR